MASPIGFGDCLAIIQEGIKIYEKVKDTKEQIRDMGGRLEGLKKYISRIESIITINKQSALVKLRPDLANDINDILRRIKKDARQVVGILKAWHERESPFAGLAWSSRRFSDFVNAVFSRKPEELDQLSKRLEREETEMRDWFSMLQTIGIDELLKQGDTKTLKPPPSPVPGRPKSPMRENYDIIFIDSFNEGRSVVAQAYTLLVKEWTVRTGNRWPLAAVDSAGHLVRFHSELSRQLEALRMTMRDGNRPPMSMAVTALFDNTKFNHPYKSQIQQNCLARRSRGVKSTLFNAHDFILVFNPIDAANLERLREHLLTESSSLTPNPQVALQAGKKLFKAKIKLLGEYGGSGKAEIWNPPKTKDEDEKAAREAWNAVVSNIRVSIKGFLRREVGWIEPRRGLVQT